MSPAAPKAVISSAAAWPTGVEAEPKFAAALISTAILMPAAMFARSALEMARPATPPETAPRSKRAKAPAIVGRLGLAALFVFGFLCTRGVEILYLLGPDTPLTAESFSEGYFAVSAAHCGLALFSTLWLVLVLLRTAKRGVLPRPSKFMTGAVRCQLVLTASWLLLVVSYYLL